MKDLKNQRKDLTVRHATIKDAEQLWHWANDRSVREQSFNTEPIEWDSHIQWLGKRMKSPDTIFYLLLENEIPVGQIRYDRIGDDAEISFSIDKKHREKKLGIEILLRTRELALRDLNCKRIIASVIKGNDASQKAFLKADFREDGTAEINEIKAFRFVWKP